jgi:hypothetical protein
MPCIENVEPQLVMHLHEIDEATLNLSKIDIVLPRRMPEKIENVDPILHAFLTLIAEPNCT